VAFNIGRLSNHPNRDELYQVLFPDLGIQILRVANWYRNSQAPGNPEDLGDFNSTAAVVAGARAALGRDPLILMSSWSPPPSMKSIANFVGGTLGQSGGAYRYADFGAWWRSALDAYAAAGVVPTFVSIQNEPDFVPPGPSTWSACLIDPSEDLAGNAGYGPALQAVASAISDLTLRPTLIGPEVSGIANNRVQKYLSAMLAGGQLSNLGGIAHHLYNGGNANLPSTFVGDMTAVAGDAGGLPLFQTEFASLSLDMFNEAWLIQNAVTVEGVAAYLHWDLIWPDSLASTSPQGLVSLENSNNPAGWQTPKGYRINGAYYAVRHFAKWIDVGWQRISATADSSVIRSSAFVSADGQSLTAVLINTDTNPHTVTVDPGGFSFTGSAVYRTSGTDERTAPLGPLAGGGAVEMPARSLVTVVLTP
jgi:glucuronoarabinoxylan endo-1,4-beta-xylanase